MSEGRDLQTGKSPSPELNYNTRRPTQACLNAISREITKELNGLVLELGLKTQVPEECVIKALESVYSYTWEHSRPVEVYTLHRFAAAFFSAFYPVCYRTAGSLSSMLDNECNPSPSHGIKLSPEAEAKMEEILLQLLKRNRQ